MSVLGKLMVITLVAAGAGWAGLKAGEGGITLSGLQDLAQTQIALLAGQEVVTEQRSDATGPVIYWRHPDGLPEWSASEQQTADGRAFLPVLESEDINAI